ncbi:hypothetical protein CEE35_07635 [Candidatus Aerophobetes bacterium Ae_b3b]|nr:MAG: hypothetical protein CEE35_07635 [Candidatus Aerophobetes bacterium Ae_b3b]
MQGRLTKNIFVIIIHTKYTEVFAEDKGVFFREGAFFIRYEEVLRDKGVFTKRWRCLLFLGGWYAAGF